MGTAADLRVLAACTLLPASCSHSRHPGSRAGTLAKEAPLEESFPSRERPREAGPLFRIKWFRVILDEASAIKNRASDNAKAVYKLKSKRRWCLTGTPIQNSLDDLIALFVFVK